MAFQKLKQSGLAHRKIVQDEPCEDGIARSKTSMDKQHVVAYRHDVSRIPRHNKWMTGRSVATLHR